MITWNQHLVKKSNKSLVLQTVKEQAPLSRADISQRSGLNKGTVSSLVHELIEEQLIYEIGPGESSGGRRPVMLLFNQLAGYAVGIDLGVNYILGVLTDLQGNIVKETSVNCSSSTFESMIQHLKETIQSLIDAAPDSYYGIVGIGVGVPGIVDKEGEILLAPNLGWRNIDLKEQIEQHFHLPVIIDNEANAGAYGEKKFGAGQDVDNLVYISAGIGIGVGYIFNGELYRGLNGFSGEMGHMIIEVNGKPCRCGSKGCWELYASEQALLTEAEQLKPLGQQSEKPSLETLLELARHRNKEVLQLFEHIGSYLGFGINNIINSFNPQKIVIGNRLAMAEEWLKEPVERVIESHTLPFHRVDLQLHFSKLSTYSAALGVSAFATENFLRAELHEK
ncbi:ROK family transcriptional regulator [Brevibacillus humidisoli]|uniref:ROK family transcriptional regulator n=1 Tax=Brevibacillus humidisoli TaxID=2895522 RepID=UPI001E4C8E89|nr:ROK family transcriptional regulator [Brevibacillus humidisoli]UFJ40289.1 ROK family transcriptional regulator [Brevibacillus humidisoli]